jgi:hypothetical protein
MLYMPVALAVALLLRWLLPPEVAVAVGPLLIAVGFAGSFRLDPSAIPTRQAQIASACIAVGFFVVIEHLSLRWLSLGALACGVIMLARWPSIVRANPDARRVRNLYMLMAVVVAALGVPLLILEAGIDWNRPVVTCFALLPLAGWALLVGVVSIRLQREMPVPQGVEADVARQQIEAIQQIAQQFMKPLPFVVSSLAVLGIIAGTMVYGSAQVGAVLASVLILVSFELIVRKRRVWSVWANWLLLGVLVGCITTLDLASNHWLVAVAVLVTSLLLVFDALMAGLGRRMRWNIVPATTVPEVALFLAVPTASITASVVTIATAP